MKRRLFRNSFPILAIAGLLSTSGFAQGVINTVAGTGTYGTTGDGGSARSANIAAPQGVAVNRSGDMYIVYGSTLRKVSGTTGVISSISISSTVISAANVWVDESDNVYITDRFHDQVFKVAGSSISVHCGNGHQGRTGDGGDCHDGTFMIPAASCVDGMGNTYIADYGSNEIRKVNTSGILSRVAGTGTSGFSGDGGSAVLAKISAPSGVACDHDGNVYFTDKGNHRIRKIDIATGNISTICGTGTAGFSGDGSAAVSAQIKSPTGISIDLAGNIFFCDNGNNRIRKINVDGIITTIAGTGIAGYSGDGGSPLAAKISNPTGVWVDESASVYIADASNNRIRKISFSPTGPKASLGENETNRLTVSPNPSSGLVTLTVSEDMLNQPVQVVALDGRVVYSSTIVSLNQEISLDQPAGIYMIEVLGTSGKTTQKLVLNK